MRHIYEHVLRSLGMRSAHERLEVCQIAGKARRCRLSSSEENIEKAALSVTPGPSKIVQRRILRQPPAEALCEALRRVLHFRVHLVLHMRFDV